MKCSDVEQGEVAERYVRGELAEEQRDPFEMHFFDCPRCFDEVRMLQALRSELGTAPTRAPSALKWRLALGSAAALVLAVLGTLWWSGRQPSDLSELARVEPAPYEEVRLRSATDPSAEAFRVAMRHYLDGDYRMAIRGLEAAEQENPGAAHVRFFLGVSCLLAGENERAIDRLRQVSESDSPFAQEAGYYLAKALIAKGDSDRAREALREVRAAGGTHAAEAGRLLEKLEALAGGS